MLTAIIIYYYFKNFIKVILVSLSLIIEQDLFMHIYIYIYTYIYIYIYIYRAPLRKGCVGLKVTCGLQNGEVN